MMHPAQFFELGRLQRLQGKKAGICMWHNCRHIFISDYTRLAGRQNGDVEETFGMLTKCQQGRPGRSKDDDNR